jgi:hypothetical protein
MNPLTGSFPAEKRVRVSGWTTLPSNKAQPLMEALYNQGPVVVAVDANDWFDYDGGVFDGCKKDAELGHAVLAKGYGGDGNAKYWRIQNSWGGSWGEQGHIRLKRQDAAEEEAHCGTDRKPQEGLGCDGGPPEITVCGMCGILFDPIYPEGVTIEGGDAPVDKTAFRGYQPKPIVEDFSMPPEWSSRVGDEMEEERLSAVPHTEEPQQPKMFHPSESTDQVKKDMEKNAVNQMQEMFMKGQI